ncbi:MAG: site-specific integrase [Anaerolineae bacterium]|nr:site-specific integrase [Anaerolineae bacterium]
MSHNSSDLSGFQQWWEQTTKRTFQVKHLVARYIRRWQRERQQVDDAKPSTINRGLSSLRGFCRWAVENGRHTNDPTGLFIDIVKKTTLRIDVIWIAQCSKSLS